MNTKLNDLISNPMFSRLIITLLGIATIMIIIKMLKGYLGRRISDKENWYKSRKVINIVGYILIGILITLVYSDKLQEVSVIIGVTGAGLAFALQEVIVSVAGWIAIIAGGMYSTGDRIQLGGIKGDVIDLSILRTTIMEIGDWVDADLYNGKIVRVANSFVFKEPVYNYSSDFPFLWDEIKVPIKFGSDYKAAREIINKAAEDIISEYGQQARDQWETMVRKYLIEDASTLPMTTVVVNDNWVEYTLRYVVDYRKRRSTKDKLFEEILMAVESSQGKVKFASATVELVEMPAIDVNIEQHTG